MLLPKPKLRAVVVRYRQLAIILSHIFWVGNIHELAPLSSMLVPLEYSPPYMNTPPDSVDEMRT